MIRKIFFILCLAFVFSSCTLSDFNRDNFVKTSSSAAGGYVGYHLSDGDLFSTSIGSTVGLIFGSYLADFIGQDDYFFYKQETLKTLEINDNNESLVTGYWKNPKSGNTGVIKIKGYYGKPNCRLIEHVYINQNNIAQNSYDTACRAESGQWAMIK
jgi:surface antigen